MSKAIVHIISNWSHCSQVLTGFLKLADQGRIEIEVFRDQQVSSYTNNMAAVQVEYEGKTITYDVMDGYQNIEGMRYLLGASDYYFKRSFSTIRNADTFTLDEVAKMRPLGMNYLVSCQNNPYNRGGGYRRIFFLMRGDKPNSYFTQDKFETEPEYKSRDIKVLFFTRLWDLDINNAEALNEQRIRIIRALKKQYKDNFLGGIRASDLAMKYAPDLIVSKRVTERSNYLKLLRDADICIGTLGLHQSTGWKTAEYVAASKAIINEKMVYEVPGSFDEGANYLPFSNEEECCECVEKLMSDPVLIYEMKRNNQDYYNRYLMPSVMIKNTLDQLE